MPIYYVTKNAQDNGDHEVHQFGCTYMPGDSNCEYLGYFALCQDAVKAAKKKYPQSNGCYYCSKECHTQYKAQTFLNN